MNQDPTLTSQIVTCQLCPRLVQHRTNVVPAEVGSKYVQGGIALLLQSPGNLENQSGRPVQPALLGRRKTAGNVIADALDVVGVTRDELLILNRVRCQPGPRNRLVDYPEAIPNCDPWTQAELTAYNPAVVVCFGAEALQPIFGVTAKVGQTRGQWRATSQGHDYGQRLWTATWHPAAMLHQGSNPQIFDELCTDLQEAVNKWRTL